MRRPFLCNLLHYPFFWCIFILVFDFVAGFTPFFADQDVAQYLFNTLPREWLAHHRVSSTSKIVDVLQNLHGHSSLEDRVDQAFLTLGLLPA